MRICRRRWGRAKAENAKMSDTKGQSALKTRRACLDQAEKLVSAAERLLDDKPFSNIAYYLAVLALEEVGKGCLIGARNSAGGSNDPGWYDKRLNDHVFKLTWAIWTPLFGKGQINPKDSEEARQFAKRMHNDHLESLYVEL